MKRILYTGFIVILLAGCSDNTASRAERETGITDKAENDKASPSTDGNFTTEGDVNVDTIGMAQFLAYKAAEAAKRGQSNGVQKNDIRKTNNGTADTSGWAEFKKWKTETARAYEDSVQREEVIAKYNKRNASRNYGSTKGEGTTKTKGTKKEGTAKGSESKDSTATSDETAVAQQSPAKKKKGISNKAKGAVIGAAAGATAGAVINKKNRTAGGVIGGIVGAAAGYGFGRSKDKKDTLKKE